MTGLEFEQKYLGRKVRISKWWPEDTGVICQIDRGSAGDYLVAVQIGGRPYLLSPKDLQLIDELDNKPLPLPG